MCYMCCNMQQVLFHMSKSVECSAITKVIMPFHQGPCGP